MLLWWYFSSVLSTPFISSQASQPVWHTIWGLSALPSKWYVLCSVVHQYVPWGWSLTGLLETEASQCYWFVFWCAELPLLWALTSVWILDFLSLVLRTVSPRLKTTSFRAYQLWLIFHKNVAELGKKKSLRSPKCNLEAELQLRVHTSVPSPWCGRMSALIKC